VSVGKTTGPTYNSNDDDDDDDDDNNNLRHYYIKQIHVVALGQVFSENFGFPCQSTFHLLLHNHLHYHPRLAQ
jgi:hypothetical protein